MKGTNEMSRMITQTELWWVKETEIREWCGWGSWKFQGSFKKKGGMQKESHGNLHRPPLSLLLKTKPCMYRMKVHGPGQERLRSYGLNGSQGLAGLGGVWTPNSQSGKPSLITRDIQQQPWRAMLLEKGYTISRTVSGQWHYWHFTPGNCLLWGVTLLIVGCVAGSLASAQ